MINSYYKDLEDPQLDSFKEEISSREFHEYMESVTEYLLEKYSCNFTQFLSQCNFPEYRDPKYWEKKMDEGVEAPLVADDGFYEIQLEKQRRHILGNRY